MGSPSSWREDSRPSCTREPLPSPSTKLVSSSAKDKSPSASSSLPFHLSWFVDLAKDTSELPLHPSGTPTNLVALRERRRRSERQRPTEVMTNERTTEELLLDQ